MRCYNFGGLISLFILCTNEEKHCFLGFSKILNFLDFFSFFLGSKKIHTGMGCKLQHNAALYRFSGSSAMANVTVILNQ